MVPLTPTSSPSRLGFLQFSPDDPRVLSSGILNTSPIDFSKYPGTGTKIMREFLEKYGDTENIRIKELPEDGKLAKSKEAELFYKVLKSVDSKSPVIVHQYWKGPNTRGHYRIVTGFDLQNNPVYLHDPKIGPISQTVSEFLSKWNVNEKWLHYNAIIFNTSHATIDF
jgi:hypothetical protein